MIRAMVVVDVRAPAGEAVGQDQNRDDLVALKELVEAGKVTPVIDGTYPLSETPEAIGHVGDGHARGTVVITVDPAVLRRRSRTDSHIDSKGTSPMSKATVTRLFIGSAIAIIAGAVLSIVAVWLAIANDVFVMNGTDMVGAPRGAPLAWYLLGLGTRRQASAIVGRLDRWPRVPGSGAVLNACAAGEQGVIHRACCCAGSSTSWWVAMIAYVNAGPDGHGSIRRPSRPVRPAAGAPA